MGRIVVIGSSNTDLVIRSERLPRPGETVRDGEFEIVAGGKGANQAVVAVRAGANVTFVANIGADAFGDAALQRLRGEGIDVRFVLRSKTAPSGTALILVGANGENLISVARSSNDELSPAHVRHAESAIRRADIVLLQMEIAKRAIREGVMLATRHGIPVLLNPAPASLLAPSILKRVDWLTPNEHELSVLTRTKCNNQKQIEDAAASLLTSGTRNVVVTCGRRGAFWCRADGYKRWFKSPRVKAVDSVAAGDCFSGYLAAALSEGRSAEDSIALAVQAASISVTRKGAQSSIPYRRELKR